LPVTPTRRLNGRGVRVELRPRRLLRVPDEVRVVHLKHADGGAHVPCTDGYRCFYCGSTKDLTVDLDPRLRGNHRGATLADCVTACRSCNSRRGALARNVRGV
jgi:5-methylcytosine-specific restriction endonuclease McrA